MSLQTRPVTPDDASAVHGLVRRWETHWNVPSFSTEARAMEWLTAPSVEMENDTLSYWEGDRIVAYGLVSYVPSNQRRHLAHLNGMVDPARTGEGIGRGLLTWQLDRGAERVSESADRLPRAIRTTTWGWIEDARRLFARFGLEEVRSFDVMAKRLGAVETAEAPEGVAITPWDPSREEEALLANNSAFTDHWGATPMSMGNWRHIIDSPETRLDLSYQAIAGDRIVGMSLAAHHPLDSRVTGRSEGWIRILSVDPDWRGKGLARALLAASNNGFIDAGLSHSLLRVDSRSLTGANRLYEKVGYATQQTFLIHEKEVGGG